MAEALGLNYDETISRAVARSLNPFQFVVIAVAGWMNQRQQNMIEYLREENRVLREQLGGRRR
jgi:hypothetical protein